MDPLKIGIVLNFKTAEKKKDELMKVNSTKRPWLKLANQREYTQFTILRDHKKHVPVDIALGLYITAFYKNVIIDYIKPTEISPKRFAENDLVFLMQYDLLEAFHLTNKTNFNKFKKTLEISPNVYPPYPYQQFINNKCIYYNYLKEKGIPVAPTICINDYPLYSRSKEKYLERFLEEIPWNSFIIKPVYGQESFGFGKFLDRQSRPGIIRRKLRSYFKKYLPKYKNIIVQKYIPGFDKNSLEARLYYIGGKYLFCMTTSGLTHTTSMREARPVQEGGTFRITDSDWNYIRRMGDHVMETLPKFDLPQSNSIITRIDIGRGLENVERTFFVNEIEFVPAFFIERHSEPIIQRIGDALVKTAEVYKTRDRSIKVDF